MKEKKIDEKPKKGRMIMWAFIYSGVFIAALIIGVVSKFVQPSWTKDFTAEWSDSVGTVYKDITYGEKDANKFDLYVPADNTKENYGLVVYLHAGGFTAGDKSGDEQILKWLCSKGYIAAGINYTLRDEAHPEASVYSQSMEIKESMPAVIAEAEKLGYHIDEMVEFYKQIYPTFDEKVFRDYNQSIGLDVSKRIKELSKGQAMSLASMLNLSIHPKVMIMDEPMSGLDVIAQKQIKDFIVNEVDMNGMSVLISSHDLKDLESFCDSASMMKDGKILYQGTMDQMKERFTKLQVVFGESRSEIFKELSGVITYSNLGSVYTVILEGYGEPIHEALKQAGAIVVEEIPLSLEEVFVYSNR